VCEGSKGGKKHIMPAYFSNNRRGHCAVHSAQRTRAASTNDARGKEEGGTSGVTEGVPCTPMHSGKNLRMVKSSVWGCWGGVCPVM